MDHRREPFGYDQWTVSGQYDSQRPLYRLKANDPAGTEIYISSTTGKLVQTTTSSVRRWNWIGSVTHWVYFAQLRRNVQLWANVVISTSLLGCLLTAAGIVLGIQRFVRRSPGTWSPFRGLLLWHHQPGLFFGLFALTWVASGLLSMNPWGLLETAGSAHEARNIAGPALTGAQIKESIRALSSGGLEPDIVSLSSAALNGRLFLVATHLSGARTRLDGAGVAAPLTSTQLTHIQLSLGASSSALNLQNSADSYYFPQGHHSIQLPVYRVVEANPGATRYYVDPLSGQILKKVDGNGRGYRWLHEGLHRIDFTASMRSRPLWDVTMLLLLCGVTATVTTGAVLGLRRCCLWVRRP